MKFDNVRFSSAALSSILFFSSGEIRIPILSVALSFKNNTPVPYYYTLRIGMFQKGLTNNVRRGIIYYVSTKLY